MHFRIQIKNATIVNELRSFVGSIVIDDERIDEIIEGRDGEPSSPVNEIIDAEGAYVLPGVIDTHVHFRDPGLTAKAYFFSESKAAAAGGVTTVFDMPNTVPQTTTMQAFNEKWETAKHKSLVNFGLFYGATGGNAYELERLNPRKVCGIKLFMGSSTGNMLVDNERTLRAVFEHARLPIVAHCEDTPTIEANLKACQAAYGADPDVCHHPEIRSAEACYKSTALAVSLAKEYGSRLHVAHLSTERELELFEAGNPLITAEACVAHLLFTDKDYARLGTRIKCNPAIKTEADRAALRRALADRRITTVATDHAPHRLRDKVGGCVKAASGMPMLQYSLVSMLELVDEGVVSIERMVELMCHAPARIFRIENRGFLREGYKADIVIVRPRTPWTVTPSRIQSLRNWSPVEGHTYHWRVERTFCNGFPIYNRGHITDERYHGQPVSFCR